MRLRYQLTAFFLVRGVINTMYRMVYPFMAVFARGLGVPVGDVALAVAARSALGLAAPLLGSSSDRRGRKRGMLLGLAVFVVGAMVVVLRPSYLPFFGAMLLTGAGKIAFDPSMQAYLGDVVGYQRRGQAIALTELGWSLAFLVGVPLMGWLIARGGWTAPFPWLAGLGVLAALALWRMLPPDSGRGGGPSLKHGLQRIAAHRAALAGLGVGLLATTANETVNIVFGVWLEGSFGLQVIALGAAAAVIGLAELGGEGLVATVSDRLGKRRAVAIGLTLNCGACLLLPVLGQSVPGALGALFLFYITFEFTLVSSIPMMTELVPQARATLMSGNVSALSAGRVLGAAAGLALYAGGLQFNTLAAFLLNLAALAVLLSLVRDQEPAEA
jgi:predicted MFS family arabinose efflux permease